MAPHDRTMAPHDRTMAPRDRTMAPHDDGPLIVSSTSFDPAAQAERRAASKSPASDSNSSTRAWAGSWDGSQTAASCRNGCSNGCITCRNDRLVEMRKMWAEEERQRSEGFMGHMGIEISNATGYGNCEVFPAYFGIDALWVGYPTGMESPSGPPWQRSVPWSLASPEISMPRMEFEKWQQQPESGGPPQPVVRSEALRERSKSAREAQMTAGNLKKGQMSTAITANREDGTLGWGFW